ncbi:leucine-rich repeat containing protein 68 [Pseudohyphozyma bogoriensis]|nr:leucine-rich repeat containing protein 68 [Pseudohyphozyma bogoriensis]
MATLKVVYPINGPNGPLAPYEESMTKKRVDFGLKKLVLESCGLDDESLKPLLHALLVAGSLPTLSLANNKRIKSKGWKLIAIFTRKARFLRYLDLSDNHIDRKAADYLVQAIAPASSNPLSALTSTESTSTSSTLPSSDPLAPSATTPQIEVPNPEVDATSVLSGDDPSEEMTEEQLLAIPDQVIDYNDGEMEEGEPIFTVAPFLKENPLDSGTVLSLRLENCGLKNQALEALAHGVRASGLKHISIRKNRINALGAVAVAIMIRDYPVSGDHANDPTSTGQASYHSNPNFEPGNSVTARQALQAPYVRKGTTSPNLSRSTSPHPPGDGDASMAGAAQAEKEAWANSEARNKLKKQIDELPRTGSLLTLDVKGNDLRNGVSYISQVLKRNRTLKVLNLSENKIDVQGLVSIAEALKYNTALETLDMSLNPCCGPALEGITSLRAAIAINSNLKRIFLNSTDLSSEGAIALAEFLPEATSLLHLDLTGNFDIDIAGVMALSVAVKMNNTLRCLDLNIPPNDPDFARLSQEILQCCVRNTELAQEESIARGKKGTIAAPILQSAVARDLKTRQDAEDRRTRRQAAASKSQQEILTAAEECRTVLTELLVTDEEAAAKGVIVQPSEVMRDLLVQAQLAEAQLAEAILATAGAQKDLALTLGDDLSRLYDRAKRLYDGHPAEPPPVSTPQRGGLAVDVASTTSPSPQLSSPSFSITGSDDEDDDEDAASNDSHGSPTRARSSAQASRETPPLDIAAVVNNDEFDAVAAPRSPTTDYSRSLTLEEGEVFRKGTALGAADVDEDELEDVSGEELKKEILETEVERSPRQSFSDMQEDAIEEPLPPIE